MLRFDFNENIEDQLRQSAYSPFQEDVFSFIRQWIGPEIKEIKMKTSGSTGKPKEIVHSKRAMEASALKTNAFFDIQESTKCLLGLPIDFVAGKMMVVRAILAKAKLTVVKPSSNPLQGLEDLFDFAPFTPHQLSSSLDDIHKVKVALIGGAAVSEGLMEKFQNITTTQFYESYGMTETISHIALKHLLQDDYFTALSGVNFSVNSKSCLVINAPDIVSGPIETTDVVQLINEQQFIWRGRADHVINSGGIKIHPEEVEKILSPYIGVPFYVHKIPDEVFGEIPVLVLENGHNVSLDKLNDHLSKNYKLKKIVSVNIINFTSRNKIIRKDIG